MTDHRPLRGLATGALGWPQRNPCLFLLVAILCHLLVQPLLHGLGRRAVFAAITTFILLASVYAVSRHRRLLVTAIVLGLPYFVAVWSYYAGSTSDFHAPEGVSGLVFFAFVTISLMSYVLGSSKVTSDMLFGAGCVYLLIGLTWSHIYIVAFLVDPASIKQPATAAGDQALVMHDFVYFSFVTLTTLGYGDIVPGTSFARSLAVVESVCGVLYLAFLVARLVSLYGQRPGSEPA